MIADRKDISAISGRLRSAGKKIVFTNGCFDILHAGHVKYLSDARQFGDILIVGLNSDSSVRRLKGSSRPVNPQEDRAAVLDALSAVDYVVIFEEDTPIELIKAVKPDVLVKGGDYTIDTIVGAGFVTENGGKVEVIPLLEGRSTTSLIEKLMNKG